MRIRERSSPRGFLWFILGLVIAFGGVYAALLLHNFQEREREQEKVRTIQTYFLSECELEKPRIEREKKAFDSMANIFLHAYRNGEMPDLREVPAFFSSGVNTCMWEAIIHSGGSETMDFKTIQMIENYEQYKMVMQEILEKGESYSRELLLPNLERNKGEYYNLWTKTLRPKYQWYIKYIQSVQKQYDDLLHANQELTEYLTQKLAESN